MEEEKSIRGKKARKDGARFEIKVRDDMKAKGWIVIKNPNNVIDGDFIKGKPKFNPFTKQMMMFSGGFPDFLCFRKKVITPSKIIPVQTIKEWTDEMNLYEVIGVESKTNGCLSKTEKEKCKWLLDNKILGQIFVTKKIKEGRLVKVCYRELPCFT